MDLTGSGSFPLARFVATIVEPELVS